MVIIQESYHTKRQDKEGILVVGPELILVTKIVRRTTEFFFFLAKAMVRSGRAKTALNGKIRKVTVICSIV